MKHIIIAVLFLIVLQGLSALELKVESFSYDPLDLTAISKPIKDYNGDKCSALRVETNVIPELYISGQDIFERRKITPSEYYFFLSFRSSMISFSAQGYTPLQYQIPLIMEPGLVYKVVLKSIGFDPSTAVNVTIISNPSDAEKWLDGKLLGTEEGHTIAPGKYKLELKKQGYSNYTREIEVSKESFLFKDMTLKPVEEERVTLKSEPTGAEAYVNGVRRGVTDTQYYLFPGKHQLRLVLPRYFPLEEEIEVRANSNNEFVFRLKRNVAIAQFSTTPSDARVYVDNSEITDKKIELAEGSYSLEVKKIGYDDYRKTISVVAGKDETHTINLTQQTGSITFEVNPISAKVALKRDSQTVQEWMGSKQINNLPVGDYTIEVSLSGYKSETQSFNLKKDESLTKSITLREVLVSINSEPSGAEIYLSGVNKEKTNTQFFLYPGKYQLRLILSGYFPLEEEIEVRESSKNEFSFSLKRNSAIVQFKTTPSDAKVYISREEVVNKRIELADGTYSLEVKREGYDDYQKTITVIAGKDETHTINLTQQTGTVTFEVNPMNAKVILSRGNQAVQQWTGSNRLTDLPVGEYSVAVSASGYKSVKQDFTLRKDERLTKSVYLEEGSDAPEKFVLVEGGSFTRSGYSVTLDSFYIDKYELTQKEWVEVMGSNPSNWKGDNLPVERVTWYNVIDYCNKRSVKEGLTPCYSINGNTSPSSWTSGTIVCNWNADGYRLPTEAEWEYAARGGKQSKGYTYSGSNNLSEVGWYSSNSGSKTHPVGEKQSNELGIYDMSGNVWEWCWDWYGSYPSSSQNNPKGPESGSNRVRRGGGCSYGGGYCAVSYRDDISPSYSSSNLGVRVVRVFR